MDKVKEVENAMDGIVTFKPSMNHQFGTSGLQGGVVASYRQLVNLFGEPNSTGDEYKVSTEWILENKRGETVTLYDYKETNLYSSENPSIEEFRNLPNYIWHIGGSRQQQADDLAKFIEFSLND
jgi:hypothetical protein